MLGTKTSSKERLAALEAVPMFRACSRKQLELVARLADNVTVEAGEVLAREGRIERELFVIMSGEAQVSRAGTPVARLGAGDYFGELAVLDAGPRDATVTAISDLEVLIVGQREYATMVADIPGLRDALLKGMAKRLRAADIGGTLPAPDGLGDGKAGDGHAPGGNGYDA
jgi:CRP-like cAMP-binding protein